ncbi:MAG TPA: LysM peptidoglycan-binding domain-containing protein [Anaerolineaceae bacterium]|nr:LysM peptidoglycan-binding domain-containing protein [Anaerolineaceae bacterium]
MQKQLLAIFAILFLLLGISTIYVASNVSANQDQQVYYFTPTAQPDGRILYIVKEGDTCISISLLNNVSEDDLRLLNDLGGDGCLFLRVGRELVLGTVEPEPEIAPEFTATSILPLPTAFAGTGDICVLLFEDINGNTLIDDNTVELPLAGGEVSITDRMGQVNLTESTNNMEELCFTELDEGEYTISVAIPSGYNPTMRNSATLKLNAGETVRIDFGAQLSSAGEAELEETPTSNRSPLLGIIGGLILVFGLFFGFYAIRLQRR